MGKGGNWAQPTTLLINPINNFIQATYLRDSCNCTLLPMVLIHTYMCNVQLLF